MKGATLSVLAVLVLIAQIAPAACADTPRALSPDSSHQRLETHRPPARKLFPDCK